MINDIDTLYAERKYRELTILKKALGINKTKEVSISIILDIAKEHNKKEVFLLKYIIEMIKNIPSEIKKQFQLMADNENNEVFADIYTQTEKKFAADFIFKNYYKKTFNELSLKEANNRYFFNSLIYEMVYKEISDKSVFSEKNTIINLYLLQKWLRKHTIIPLIRLSAKEKTVIKFLTEGYTDDEIISLSLMPQYESNEIYGLIEHQLPEKFKAENITQVLAIYFYKFC